MREVTGFRYLHDHLRARSGEVHYQTGVDPGDTTIKAVIDGGADTAMDRVLVEEGVIDYVWITNSDIVP